MYHIISHNGWNISHAANVLWAKMVFFFLLNLLVCYLQKNYFLEVCWLHEYLIGFVITIVFLTKFYPILIEVLLLVAQKVFSPSFLYVIGSQCSAGTVSVCLTCSTLSLWWPVWQWKGQLCPHSISLIRVRGNMTICSWITKLHWLWSFYGFELSCWMDVYYLHCYSPLCLCFLATNILNQSNSLGSRSGWRQDTINLTRFHSPFQCWFNKIP